MRDEGVQVLGPPSVCNVILDGDVDPVAVVVAFKVLTYFFNLVIWIS